MAARTKRRASDPAPDDFPHLGMGGRFKEVRERLGLDPAQMAKRMRVSLSAYYAYECGARAPRIADLPRITSRLRVSADWLIGAKDAAA